MVWGTDTCGALSLFQFVAGACFSDEDAEAEQGGYALANDVYEYSR